MTRKARSSASQKHRHQGTASRRPVPFVVAGIGLVVVGAAVIAVALALGQPTIPQPSTATTVVSGTPLPEYTAGAADPAVGMALPSLSNIGLDGAPMTISADGRAKAIVVLAHWCPHCQAEVPRIVDWLAANTVPNGVDIVALTTNISPTQTNYPPSEWLEREGWTVPTMIDDAASTGYLALGGMNFPGWVFVGADGNVQLRTTGELDMDAFSQMLNQIAP